MADISINPISTAQATVNAAPVVQTKPAQTVNRVVSENNNNSNTRKVAEDARKEADRRAELIARENARAKEYGPVISRSSDGDTVRVKAKAIDPAAYDPNKAYEASQLKDETEKIQMQDFDIPKPEIQDFDIPKPEYVPFEFPDAVKNASTGSNNTEPVTVQPAENTEPAASSQSSSINSLSESELKRMYLQGDISQNAYNKELEAREARKEQLEAANNEFSTDMTQNAAMAEEVAREETTVENLASEQSSEDIPVDIRAQFF